MYARSYLRHNGAAHITIKTNIRSLAHMSMDRLYGTNTNWLDAHTHTHTRETSTHTHNKPEPNNSRKTFFVGHTPHARNEYRHLLYSVHVHDCVRLLSCSRFDDELNTEWFGRIHCEVFFSFIRFVRSFIHFAPNLHIACMCALLSRQLLL